MKRLSPPALLVLTLSLVVGLAAPALAAEERSAAGDPLAPLPERVTAAEEAEILQSQGFQLLSGGEITVTWGGFGHGIGMPQYGAQAMAEQGKGYKQILQHFYTGAQFAKTDLEGGGIYHHKDPISIGIGQNMASTSFTAESGSVTVCLGGACHNVPEGQVWTIERNVSSCLLKQGTVVKAETTCVDPPFVIENDGVKQTGHGYEFASIEWGGQPDTRVRFTSGFHSSRDTYARGRIGFRAALHGNFHVQLQLPLEEYLYGLAEVPNSWHPEALKAQAVAARSFALYKVWAYRKQPEGWRLDCACQLLNTTADQAYHGWNDDPGSGSSEGGAQGHKWRDAVNDSGAEAMWHPHHGSSRALEAYYFSSTGGATENNLDRWPNGGAAYPYLTSKPDPGARYETKTYSVSDFATKLGFPGGKVLQVQIPARYDSQRPKKVVVTGETATGQLVVKEFTSTGFRNALGYGKGDWVKSITGVSFIDGLVPGALVLHKKPTAQWLYLAGGQSFIVNYGRPGDIALMGDWDGDGVDTPGLYRQSDGFVYLRNSNSDGWADVEFFFGRSGDIPVVGDFDGDGVDTVSVYRPSTGKFYIKNKLKDGWADYEFVFGRPGDVPFAGDWDGDGVDSVGLRRPSNGFVYLRNKNSAGWADHEFFYGKAGDVVFAGDWNGDGKDSIGLYRPSNGFIYLRNKLSSGNADIEYHVGTGFQGVFSGQLVP